VTKLVTYVEIDVPQFVFDLDFVTNYNFVPSTLAGWTGTDMTATATAAGATIVQTGSDPSFRSPAAQSINGEANRYLAIDVERTAVRTVSNWQGDVYWTTADHPESNDFRTKFGELENYVGARRTYYLDMHDLVFGGDDWETSTITQLRIDFEGGDGQVPDGEFLIRSVRLGDLADPYPTETFRFAVPASYLPADIEAIPSIESVDFQPATISLGENLGQRASLTIQFKDHRHSFAGEPWDRGTFFSKWRGRYGARLRGLPIRLIRGVVGQSLVEMDTRHYVVDTTDGPEFNANYRIIAKDILKLADDDRAQAPALSNGSLAGSINNSTTSATLDPAGIGNLEYPASGWVCIGGKEVCAFTRSGDSLTIDRAEFGTTATEHDAGDRVQLVLRYTGNTPADIIEDLLTNYAGISSSYIDLAAWEAECANHLGVIYASTITEPTSVNKLVSALIEQAALAVWWDDRALQIRLQVLREISTDADVFDADRMLEGSFSVKEQPTKRISQIWTYYGQRDPTDSGANEDNYRAALASVDLELETDYGSAEIRKIEGNWIETLTAATRLNSIQLSRYRNPPRAFSWELFRDEAVILAGGYQLGWWGNTDHDGNPRYALVQVTRITVYPDRMKIEAEEMLASGEIILVSVVFLRTTGGVFSWTVADNWNDADNTVEVIGGGGGGARNQFDGGARGGGGGAYSAVSNLNLTPGGSVSYRVGSGGAGGILSSQNGGDGGDTWFNGASLGASSVGAKGGTGGSGRTGGGVGGSAGSGIGSIKFSGGNAGSGAGGDPNSGGGGGGAAGGPHGNGAAAGNASGTDGSGGGGADGGSAGSSDGPGGNNRFNFGGGADGVSGEQGGGGGGGDTGNAGGPGGNGEQLWTQTIAPITSAGPGGGGGGGGRDSNGGHAGEYGGGGGGAGEDPPSGGGNGAQGIIIITWRE
jgi:hypothetical protein